MDLYKNLYGALYDDSPAAEEDIIREEKEEKEANN